MQLKIEMSHITISRIFSTYNKFLDNLIEEDRKKRIPETYNTLHHLYQSVPKGVREHLKQTYPDIIKYLNTGK